MLESLRSVAQTAVAALHTRLELAAVEMEEQGARAAQILVYAALAGFCLALAIILGAILLVVLFWDSGRVAILASLTGLFGAGAVALGLAARKVLRERPRALAATLAELKNDIEALRAATEPPKTP
ncbi:MAG: phage holin family protein [Clostridia bacterium]